MSRGRASWCGFPPRWLGHVTSAYRVLLRCSGTALIGSFIFTPVNPVRFPSAIYYMMAARGFEPCLPNLVRAVVWSGFSKGLPET